MIAYYFGCWSPKDIGHYLYTTNGMGSHRSFIPINERVLDSGLLNYVPDVEGNAVLFHGRGWTILSFWDRSGDSRGASNSTFLIKVPMLGFEEAIRIAKELFPERWALIKFEVKEYNEQT